MSSMLSSRPNTIGHDIEPLARHVDGRAVGQVPAGIEVQAHEGVAGLQKRQEHGLVHLAARVRLDIGEFAAKKLLGTLDGQRFGDIHELAAAIIALAGVTFGIFVSSSPSPALP